MWVAVPEMSEAEEVQWMLEVGEVKEYQEGLGVGTELPQVVG
jgi:hypothetical protein